MSECRAILLLSANWCAHLKSRTAVHFADECTLAIQFREWGCPLKQLNLILKTDEFHRESAEKFQDRVWFCRRGPKFQEFGMAVALTGTTKRKTLKQGSKMLVLSRKQGEQLLIGDDIVLTINRISGNRVAIGIDAPREIRVVRGELDRHEVADGGAAPVAMSMDESSLAIASEPHQ